MTITILHTKLNPPPCRKNLVSRPRLLELLNEGLTKRLTIISAPAGFGKTTLLADWIQTISGPVSWYSLDENDNEIQRFWSRR